MLCTNYNVGLKTRREASIRPLKKKSRSTNTPPNTLHQNFVLKRAELKSTQTLKDFMYMDLHPTLRNINKHVRASWFVNTSEAQNKPRGFVQITPQHQTTSLSQPRIPPRTVRCGDKKWAKHAVPDEGVLHLWRGVLSYTNLYELSRFIYKADWIGCETQLEQISAQRKQF